MQNSKVSAMDGINGRDTWRATPSQYKARPTDTAFSKKTATNNLGSLRQSNACRRYPSAGQLHVLADLAQRLRWKSVLGIGDFLHPVT